MAKKLVLSRAMERMSVTVEMLGLVESTIEQLEDRRLSDRTRIRLLDYAIAHCRKRLRRQCELRAKARIYEFIYVCTLTKHAYGWRPSRRTSAKPDNQLSLPIVTQYDEPRI